MLGGCKGLPYSPSALALLSERFVLHCFTSKFYYPALPTLVGSQNQVHTELDKYFHWSSFSVTVSVGGRWQGCFSLTGSPWKPPCCASYLPGASTNPSWHQFPSSSIGDEFKCYNTKQCFNFSFNKFINTY